jgi:DNA-binding response OmpR family regulator
MARSFATWGGAVPEIAVVAPEGPAASPLLAGLQQRGALVRACWYGYPDLERRLLGVRPDAVVFWLDSDGGVRGDFELVNALAGRLRALAVPSVAALTESGLPDNHELVVALDDFILPPVRPEEVLIRIRIASARRGPGPSNLLSAGTLSLDPEGFCAYVGGRPLDLTYKEFELLRFLLVNRGKVVSRQAILNHVWGYDFYGGLRTVDAHIRRLRSKIGSLAPEAIETIRNVGYRIP